MRNPSEGQNQKFYFWVGFNTLFYSELSRFWLSLPYTRCKHLNATTLEAEDDWKFFVEHACQWLVKKSKKKPSSLAVESYNHFASPQVISSPLSPLLQMHAHTPRRFLTFPLLWYWMKAGMFIFSVQCQTEDRSKQDGQSVNEGCASVKQGYTKSRNNKWVIMCSCGSQ